MPPALGVKYKNKSLLNYGDLAVLSFHATKVFTTFEGGAIVSHSSNVKKEIDQLKNFAILGVEDVGGLGINGKMNEAEVMGLLQLKYINRNLEKRKRIFEKYNDSFSNDRNVRIPIIPNTVEYNYAYFPLYFKKGISIRDKVYEGLIKKNVFCRKYWYPLITDFEIYSNCRKTELINAKSLSDSTLCLPIYPDLTQNQQEYIINEIKELF